MEGGTLHGDGSIIFSKTSHLLLKTHCVISNKQNELLILNIFLFNVHSTVATIQHANCEYISLMPHSADHIYNDFLTMKEVVGGKHT